MDATSKTIAVIVGIVVLVLVVGIAAGWFGGAATTAEPYSGLSPIPGNMIMPTSTAASSSPQAASATSGISFEGKVSTGIGVAAGEAVVTYTDQGFSPRSITVPKGGTVIFKNQSSRSFWPASNPHPTHTSYPEREGCVASTFDACGPQPPDTSWEFTFDVAGTWGYHDHLNSSKTGTVIVK